MEIGSLIAKCLLGIFFDYIVVTPDIYI